MRCLTVQQPWAWCIFHGKGIENRTQLWSYRGPLAIHAGGRFSDRGLASPLVQDAAVAANPDRPVVYPFNGKVWRHEASLPRGAILGTVDLVDVHHEQGGCCAPWGEESYVEHGGKLRKQIVHLVLENPVEFAEPILSVRGRLGLWTPDADLLDAITSRTERAA